MEIFSLKLINFNNLFMLESLYKNADDVVNLKILLLRHDAVKNVQKVQCSAGRLR